MFNQDYVIVPLGKVNRPVQNDTLETLSGNLCFA